MEIDEIVYELERILLALKKIKDTTEIEDKEVMMWRNRYLESLPIERNTEKGAFIWNCFLWTPSADMTKSSPEKIINEVRRCYESR